MRSRRDGQTSLLVFLGSVAVLMIVAGLASAATPAAEVPLGTDRSVSRSVRTKAEQYIDYWNAIPLTADQQRVKAEALDAIKAPCCSEYTMATCCCPCNLAKSVWKPPG